MSVGQSRILGGYLAAASQLDWPQVEKWLGQGRPRSLIALQALIIIAKPRPLWIRRIAPKLGNPPGREDLLRTLSSYRERDPAPVVQKRIEWITEFADALTAPQ